MLLRETCLMSMANKRVTSSEVGVAAGGGTGAGTPSTELMKINIPPIF